MAPVSDGGEGPPAHLRGARGPVPSAHRRPGYPLSGCVPAEPDSVSPGGPTLTNRPRRNKSNDPERPALRSVPLNPGGSVLLADVGPFCAPITTAKASMSSATGPGVSLLTTTRASHRGHLTVPPSREG